MIEGKVSLMLPDPIEYVKLTVDSAKERCSTLHYALDMLFMMIGFW